MSNEQLDRVHGRRGRHLEDLEVPPVDRTRTAEHAAWPRTAVAALATVVWLLLATGCSDRDHRGEPEFASGAMSGVNERVADVLLRDVVVQEPTYGEEIPAGGTARLTLLLLNDGARADSLVEVTSPVADSTALFADRDGDRSFDEVESLRVLPKAAPPVGGEGFPYYVELRGLNEGLRVGESLSVSFRFAEAGTVRMDIPVALPDRITEDPVKQRPGTAG